MTFAPEGGYGEHQGQSVFTHGLQVGMEAINARNLRHRDEPADSGARAEQPEPSADRQFQNITIAGRAGLATVLTNVSDVTRQQERIALYTTQLQDGNLFFVVGVAPTRRVQRLPEHLQSLSAVAAAERRI